MTEAELIALIDKYDISEISMSDFIIGIKSHVDEQVKKALHELLDYLESEDEFIRNRSKHIVISTFMEYKTQAAINKLRNDE